jgi:hypothetical protein
MLVRLALNRLQLRSCEFQLTSSAMPSISDVGGGQVKDEVPHSLANVSFRWMLQEIHRSQCGILFDYHALQDLGVPTACEPSPSANQDPSASDLPSITSSLVLSLDSKSSATTSEPQPLLPQKSESSTFPRFVSFLRKLKLKAKTKDSVQLKETLADQASKPCAELDAIDSLEPIHDQLKINPLWWLLQFPIWYPGERWCVFSPKTT